MSMSSGLMRRSLDRASLMMLMALQGQYQIEFMWNLGDVLLWTLGGSTNTLKHVCACLSEFLAGLR